MTSPLMWLKSCGLATLSPSNSTAPSLVEYVLGMPGPSRWWSHPRANEIYNLYQNLAHHRDVLVMKLVEAKVTLVHRRLWSALVQLATDPVWRDAKIERLPPTARKLLAEVERAGVVRSDLIAPIWPGDKKGLKKDRLRLETNALVLGHDEHTASGAHQAVLESWMHFRDEHAVTWPPNRSRAKSLAMIENIAGQETTAFS